MLKIIIDLLLLLLVDIGLFVQAEYPHNELNSPHDGEYFDKYRWQVCERKIICSALLALLPQRIFQY